MSKREIDRLIVGSVFEIIIAVVILLATYVTFSNVGIKSSSAIAQTYANANYSMQMTYSRENTIAHKDIIDSGIIAVRNPNKESKNIDLTLVYNGDARNLETMKAYIDGKEVDLTNYTLEDGLYKIVVSNINIGAYKEIKSEFVMNGDALYGDNFTYSFECNGYNEGVTNI